MTIDERAKCYHQRIIANNPQAEAYDFQSAYYCGATEQQVIDIEKACEWLSINYGHFDGKVEDLVNDFRKAMNELDK